jgi:hypothetical protein
MAIEKITAPSAVPASVADWEAVLDIQAALLLAVQGAERIVGGNVVKGAVFLVGGATYLATADTAITGSASDYVKLTVSLDGLTLAPSYVADLTGVAWDPANNGYYDIDGNLYVFDELKALAGAAIAAAALRAIGGKNLAAGWAKALTAPGSGWPAILTKPSYIYPAPDTADRVFYTPGGAGVNSLSFRVYLPVMVRMNIASGRTGTIYMGSIAASNIVATKANSSLTVALNPGDYFFESSIGEQAITLLSMFGGETATDAWEQL